jgi:hypothetical protein
LDFELLVRFELEGRDEGLLAGSREADRFAEDRWELDWRLEEFPLGR